MEPERSFLCSQDPSTGLYSEPDQSSPYRLSYLRPILILSANLRLGPPSGPFLSDFSAVNEDTVM
jgi:hypothetical protein